MTKDDDDLLHSAVQCLLSAQAQRDRYRKALEEIEALAQVTDCEPPPFVEAVQIARTALRNNT